MIATLSAGALGVATHYIAFVAGQKGQPVLISFFIFVTGKLMVPLTLDILILLHKITQLIDFMYIIIII